MVTAGGKAFVLAIDHRASFRKWAAGCLGHEAPPAVLSDLKLIVAEALIGVLGDQLPTSEVAILAEPEYGAGAIARARAAGIRVVVPAERSGMPEFIFEHGDDFPAAITSSGADVVKALVRYNPSSGSDRNERSLQRLVRLDGWCTEAGYPLMLELLVPPGDQELDENGEAPPEFDTEVRPGLTCTAIAELRDAGMRPQWWKLEGQPDPGSFADVARETGAAAGETACLVLGRGAVGAQLTAWIEMAAATAGYAGFAVGRSLWVPSLEQVLLGRLSSAEAARRIGEAYVTLIGQYERAERRAIPARVVS